MINRPLTRSTRRRISTVLATGLPVIVATIAASASLGHPVLSSASSTMSPPEASIGRPPSPSSAAPSPTDLLWTGRRQPPGELGDAIPGGPSDPRRDRNGALAKSDGVVPDGVTVFDDGYPAVSKLEPALLRALRRAATVAARDSITFHVDSGWRSRRYQEQLFRQAVSEYGSEAKAARWVAIPGTSAHESGEAVDIGPSAATAWLSAHGAGYGLCQIYRNEPWHYELRPDAIDRGCPAMYADAAHDPRTQR